MTQKISLLHTLILFIIWTALTLWGIKFIVGTQTIALDKLVSSYLIYTTLLAALLVVSYSFISGNAKIIGFTSNYTLKAKIYIFPVSIIMLGLIVTLYSGLNVFSAGVGLALINTLFVGISEEVMFRGILLSSLTQRLSFWKSAIIMSLAFGLIHVLNVFVTGELTQALLQAGMATLTGLLFLGIRVRINSIVPAIIIHWLWDFMVFVNSPGLIAESQANSPLQITLHILLIISPLVFAIIGIIACKNKEAQKSFMQTQRNS